MSSPPPRSKARRRRTVTAALGLVVLAVLGGALLSRPLILRLQTAYYLRELESGVEARVERGFRAFTQDLPPDALHLLCDAAERSPPRPLYFQIVRVIHARCSLPMALESEALPTADELRRMVKAKFAADDSRPGRNP